VVHYLTSKASVSDQGQAKGGKVVAIIPRSGKGIWSLLSNWRKRSYPLRDDPTKVKGKGISFVSAAIEHHGNCPFSGVTYISVDVSITASRGRSIHPAIWDHSVHGVPCFIS